MEAPTNVEAWDAANIVIDWLIDHIKSDPLNKELVVITQVTVEEIKHIRSLISFEMDKG